MKRWFENFVLTSHIFHFRYTAMALPFKETVENHDRIREEVRETLKLPVEQEQRVHAQHRHGDVDRSGLEAAGKTDVRILLDVNPCWIIDDLQICVDS